MSSDHITMTTRAARNVVFKDLDGLNQKVRDIYSDLMDCPWPGENESDQTRAVVGLTSEGALAFYDEDQVELCDWAEVGHEWNEGDVSQVVADHMESGSLLLRFTNYGDGDHYHLLTPGKFERVNIPVLLGFKKADLHGYWSEDKDLTD